MLQDWSRESDYNDNIGIWKYYTRDGIICLVKDYCKPRFNTEQVSYIKKTLNLFGGDRQSHHAAGNFLYLTAKQKGDLDSRKQIKAKREVENVLEGRYDYLQKRGFSVRR